jgi:site-specific DNA-methyltransferase (adenine-specific)
MWVYGTGFPKSLDVSKAIDKAAGAERKVVGRYQPPGVDKPWGLSKALDKRVVDVFASSRNNLDITAPATDASHQWNGWGTALKPAWEPIIVARKPIEGTVVSNVLQYGTGAMNIGESRVPTGDRFPANVIHDGSDEVLELFPKAPGQIARARTDGESQCNNTFGKLRHVTSNPAPRGDSGSAARFFYCARASSSDRGDGNTHPTVKPTELMRYLCKLVTPPNGTILDPFMGSGSTGVAATAEGFSFIGIEKEPAYFDIAQKRISQ